MAQKLTQATRMVHGVVATFQVTQAIYDEWEAAGLLYPGVVKEKQQDPPADPPADPAPAPQKRATRKKASDDDAATDPAEA